MQSNRPLKRARSDSPPSRMLYICFIADEPSMIEFDRASTPEGDAIAGALMTIGRSSDYKKGNGLMTIINAYVEGKEILPAPEITALFGAFKNWGTWAWVDDESLVSNVFEGQFIFCYV